MKDFIYEKENSLSEDSCNNLIEYYEENNDYQIQDKIVEGLNTKKRYSKGLDIDFFDKYTPLKDTLFILQAELLENVNIYFHTLKNKNITVNDLHKISIKDLHIHKYNKKEGFFIYHEDKMMVDKKRTRFLTFIWYLNDVEEGGETEFFGYYKIKPQRGKLLLFPSDWIFPHSSKKPISDDKMILSGWIYKDVY